jgi:hypothetical protein
MRVWKRQPWYYLFIESYLYAKAFVFTFYPNKSGSLPFCVPNRLLPVYDMRKNRNTRRSFFFFTLANPTQTWHMASPAQLQWLDPSNTIGTGDKVPRTVVLVVGHQMV